MNSMRAVKRMMSASGTKLRPAQLLINGSVLYANNVIAYSANVRQTLPVICGQVGRNLSVQQHAA